MELTIQKLLECGVHFGHQTRRWNPKMAPYIFGSKDKIHIINLDRTFEMMKTALKAATDIVAGGGRILFVGTKRQASDRIAEAANRCGQYYVNHRWLGGMLTNWKTISMSLKKLDYLEKRINDKDIVLKKKELLNIQRKIDKITQALGGVRNMGGIPSMIFVLDVIQDKTAVEEARILGIPVIGVCDTNSDPTNVTYPIPGNDDSTRAIDLYCSAMEDAVIEGIQKGLTASGVDIGALETPLEVSDKKDSGEADDAAEVAEASNSDQEKEQN